MTEDGRRQRTPDPRPPCSPANDYRLPLFHLHWPGENRLVRVKEAVRGGCAPSGRGSEPGTAFHPQIRQVRARSTSLRASPERQPNGAGSARQSAD
jgi:hypothetical protein